jgi:hypothetical protein
MHVPHKRHRTLWPCSSVHVLLYPLASLHSSRCILLSGYSAGFAAPRQACGYKHFSKAQEGVVESRSKVKQDGGVDLLALRRHHPCNAVTFAQAIFPVHEAPKGQGLQSCW